MLSTIFHSVFYQPILNLFVFLYNVLPGQDLGFVILLITILIRGALYPVTSSSLKSQKSMQDLQPKLAAIRTQYPNDRQKQAQATMELYKENKVSPFSSCLPLVVQLVVMIALFYALRDGLTSNDLSSKLYPFVHNPGKLNFLAFWFLDLSKPSIVLAVLSGAAQFWQTSMLMTKPAPKEAGAGAKDENMMASMNKQMLYMMPIMTIFIGIKLSAGITLYWFFSTLLTAFQQKFLFSKKTTPGPTVPKTDSKVIEGQIVK